jgi:hypothetical protein
MLLLKISFSNGGNRIKYKRKVSGQSKSVRPDRWSGQQHLVRHPDVPLLPLRLRHPGGVAAAPRQVRRGPGPPLLAGLRDGSGLRGGGGGGGVIVRQGEVAAAAVAPAVEEEGDAPAAVPLLRRVLPLQPALPTTRAARPGTPARPRPPTTTPASPPPRSATGRSTAPTGRTRTRTSASCTDW